MGEAVLAAVPTPFAADGSLDLAGARRLFGFVAGVVDGMFVAGTTGEFPALDDGERLSLIETGLSVAGPDRVIAHIGAPDAYRAARLAAAGSTLGDWASGPAQGALLSMITTGALERHIRRMRHDYARRRAAMTAALHGGDAGRLLGDEAGMHMVLETRQPADEVAVAAAERGVAVATVERYFAGPVTRNGLVLGYGGARLADVARGCEILAGILASA